MHTENITKLTVMNQVTFIQMHKGGKKKKQHIGSAHQINILATFFSY